MAMSYLKIGDWLGLNRFYTTAIWSFVQEWGPCDFEKRMTVSQKVKI
jgi:hypothetical protein